MYVMMKKIGLLKVMFLMALTATLFNACDDGNGYSLDDAWYSIATVNPLGEYSYSLTLDDGTTLWPAATDVPWYHSDQRRRVLAVYTILSDEFDGFDHAVKVLDIQNVLTKPVAEDLGSSDENDKTYGTDPIEILDMWIGDGYLNVEFGFRNGDSSIAHYINLVPVADSDHPFTFEFRHNAYGDNAAYARKGLVAFDLSDLDTGGGEVELTIKAKSYDGEVTKQITYSPSETSTTQREAGLYNSLNDKIR